jgi:hypothetical protein
VFYFIYFFRFFLGPPSFSWGWLEWRSHGLPTLVKLDGEAFQAVFSLFSMSHFDWPITRNKTKKKKPLKAPQNRRFY